MIRLTPLVRLLLTGLATTISVIAATSDSLPGWAQAVLAGAATVFAGLGIIPPHVPAQTVVNPPPRA